MQDFMFLLKSISVFRGIALQTIYDPKNCLFSTGCNYRIPNKLISGQHCCVIYDEGKGCFAIEDTR